jgi:hypothetical protein
MTRPHVAFLLLILVLALVLFLRPRHQTLIVEAVPASACDEPVNPCLTMDCSGAGPFGGIDPDAGERDNRRIA